MKISDQIQQLLHRKTTTKDIYLSLAILHKHISGCVWSISKEQELDIEYCEHAESLETSWEKRIETADEVVSRLQENVGKEEIHKTVLGFSPEFLSEDGNMDKAIRPDIKKLTTMLDLQPVGFVNIETAILFQIKHEEGVPPSIILLSVSGDEIEMGLYRVGSLIGKRTIQMTEFVVEDVETAIKSFSDIDVLPSRMILYGAGKEVLESIKSQLLTHQWTSRTNFLHYPTIDVFELEVISRAVALAGASELTASFVEEPQVTDEEKETTTVIAQNREDISLEEKIEEDTKEDKNKNDSEEEFEMQPEDANVISVAPESFGFHQNTDILDEPEIQKEIQQQPEKEKKHKIFLFQVVPIKFIQSIVIFLSSLVKQIHVPKSASRFPLIPIISVTTLFIFGIIGLLYYLFPKATVTIGVLPNTVTKKQAVTISTAATAVDTEKFIIPGKKLEQSVSGEKTASVTGKKRIGDPGKGTVTIYNKAVASRTLSKGTILTASNIQFTLDSDVPIASASESIGSITFGKATAAVTATAIGEEGNLPAGSEFVFKDISSSVVSARNDQAFVGGTSRETTVVSRADYDSLVKALTDELITKAKADLLAGVVGGEKLLDQTIKTVVTNKTFQEELDQEATALHGKVTLTISGISYNEQDIKSTLLKVASGEIPSGYTMNEGRTVISIENPVVKKDGTINVTAVITLVSLPNIDIAKVRQELVGKTVLSAQGILKQVQGVASVEISFARTFSRARLPIKPGNIKIDVVVN